MQHESHLPSEAPRTPLSQAQPADDDIGVGDGLGAVVADILLGDDDAHWASFIPMWKSHLDFTEAPRIHPRRAGTPPPVRPILAADRLIQAFRGQLGSGATPPPAGAVLRGDDGRIGLQRSDGPTSPTDIISLMFHRARESAAMRAEGHALGESGTVILPVSASASEMVMLLQGSGGVAASWSCSCLADRQETLPSRRGAGSGKTPPPDEVMPGAPALATKPRGAIDTPGAEALLNRLILCRIMDMVVE
jgi:hypothetical protein